ncbi:MAG: helix-turn-helix domain-containing protein [Bacteroidetes bacterium]|nr:helix-turn-helix domain-containing protein [Bacteroidota bacterium]
MPNSKSIGNKIAEARKKINLSQATLAQQIAISPQAVGKWERGESLPDIVTLNKLAALLGVDLNYFSDTILSSNETIPIEQPTAKPLPTGRKKFEWNWDMSKGNWADADFSGLKNLKEQFSGSNMKNCIFNDAELTALVLANNNIEKCDFTASDLRGSKIEVSNLLNNKFNKCSFIDAVLMKNNIGKNDFSEADFSGAEFINGYFDSNTVIDVIWNITSFKNTGFSNITFNGKIQNCHFENCAFFNVTFKNVDITNTFFKYNRKMKKVVFENCKVDKLTYAFLKNNQANLTGLTVV